MSSCVSLKLIVIRTLYELKWLPFKQMPSTSAHLCFWCLLSAAESKLSAVIYEDEHSFLIASHIFTQENEVNEWEHTRN